MAMKPKRHELQDRNYRVSHGYEREKRARRILPERHLFISEGTKTEPNYLRGMVDEICRRVGENARHQFEIVGDGSCTLNLLKKAEEYQKSGAEHYQHIWILYDKDDFPEDAFDNTVKRCEALSKRNAQEHRETQFHAIWSNQCVELWFLLHYEYLQADINRSEYRRKLSEYLGQHYMKNDKQMFQTLLSHLPAARKHAKKLMNCYAESAAPSQKAPGTNFYKLIEHFESYLK